MRDERPDRHIAQNAAATRWKVALAELLEQVAEAQQRSRRLSAESYALRAHLRRLKGRVDALSER